MSLAALLKILFATGAECLASPATAAGRMCGGFRSLRCRRIKLGHWFARDSFRVACQLTPMLETRQKFRL